MPAQLKKDSIEPGIKQVSSVKFGNKEIANYAVTLHRALADSNIYSILKVRYKLDAYSILIAP